MPGFIFFIIAGVILYKFFKEIGVLNPSKWPDAARHLGLTYQNNGLLKGPIIWGVYKNHPVHLSTFTKSNGQKIETYTRYRMEYSNALPMVLRIVRQGANAPVGEGTPVQDIQTKNLAFDNLLLVQGSPENKVRDLLTLPIQNIIQNLVLYYHRVTITNHFVEIEQSGKSDKAAQIIQRVELLQNLCDQIMAAANATKEKAAHRRPPALPIILPEPPKPRPTEPKPNPPVLKSEFEIPIPELKIPKPTDPKPPEEKPVPQVLELNAVARELFGDSGSALLTSAHFTNQFKGHNAHGTGLLRRVDRFAYDPIFTGRTGVKATLELCELAGTYSKIRVQAEVLFPVELYDALKAQIDTPLSVSGRLIAHDAMLHRLYVDPV